MLHMKSKRALALLFVLVLLCSGCAKKNDSPPGSVSDSSSSEETAVSSEQSRQEKKMLPTWDDAALLEGMAPSTEPIGILQLPANSSTLSKQLALQLLTLSSGHTASNTTALFRSAGFTVLSQKNYAKAPGDPAHTCAYTIGRQQVTYCGQTRPLILVSIRGTDAGEWYANFDFAPSHSGDTAFSENFLFAAEDVFLDLERCISGENHPLILVCGHSRGGACANLLGLLLDTRFDSKDVFVYTYATPATVRGDAAEITCPNIFNFLNPCDVVPRVPLASWGYQRAGTDIWLDGTEEQIDRLDRAMETLHDIAPDIPSYYEVRHCLTAAGESDAGMTVYEVFLTLASSFISSSSGQNDESGPSLNAISKGSDLYPLFDLLTEDAAPEQSGELSLLQQHMPNTYRTQIAATAEMGQ